TYNDDIPLEDFTYTIYKNPDSLIQFTGEYDTYFQKAINTGVSEFLGKYCFRDRGDCQGEFLRALDLRMQENIQYPRRYFSHDTVFQYPTNVDKFPLLETVDTLFMKQFVGKPIDCLISYFGSPTTFLFYFQKTYPKQYRGNFTTVKYTADSWKYEYRFPFSVDSLIVSSPIKFTKPIKCN
ncbi:MAG: hypothetical protein AAF206_26960, partial [Bacteroidota bacterium]